MTDNAPVPEQRYPAPERYSLHSPQAARFGAAQGSLGPTNYPAPAHPVSSRPASRRRLWPAVVTASLLSATLAAGGTAALLTGTQPAATTPTAETAAATIQPAATHATPTVQEVAAHVGDTVVALAVTTQQGGAEGSGVIISAAGDILTNDHVVSGAHSIQVTLADARLYEAEIVGTDPTTDLAVVRLTDPPADLAVATLGDSDNLAVGAQVVAIGNPLGLAATVTSGIVSALDRPVVTANPGERPVVTNAIQVDAAVNPGNSGGPLFDLSGQVVGITSSIASTSAASGSIGLGFAIPSNLASRIASELIESGAASHAFLGVSLRNGEATADGTTRSGAQVMEVTSGSGAEAAGLRAGDVVIGVDGEAVTGADALTGTVRALAPGAKVALDVVRDGSLQKVEVTLGTAA